MNKAPLFTVVQKPLSNGVEHKPQARMTLVISR